MLWTQWKRSLVISDIRLPASDIYFEIGVKGLPNWGDSVAERLLQEDLRQDSPAHAYLLAGRSLVQKREIVPLFVQALLCQDPVDGNACSCCASCRAWERGGHPDYHSLQPEGNSLKIDQIRLWHSFFRYSPDLGRHQVFLLEQPELMTVPAANSLLKILEEPLPGTVFLLVTEDERLLLPTIVSRCRVVFVRDAQENQGKVVGVEETDAGDAQKFAGIITDGTPAELLKEVRSLGNDRPAAQGLLTSLLAEYERDYRMKRSSSQGAGVGVCLELLLRGLRQLSDNASVPLVLAVTLYRVQRELQD